MKTVYETLDGKHFSEVADAEAHETGILSQVEMWDWDKERTVNTALAAVVHLSGEGAGAIFRAMQQANPDEYEVAPENVIDDEDTGWFYWDEYEETYRYIDPSIVNILIAANHQI